MPRGNRGLSVLCAGAAPRIPYGDDQAISVHPCVVSEDGAGAGGPGAGICDRGRGPGPVYEDESGAITGRIAKPEEERHDLPE